MYSQRWERIQTLFHQALKKPVEQRKTFLESACEDPQLVSEILALLAEDASGSSILDLDLAGIAHEVLDETAPLIKKIGRYRILRVLGQGGMGVVYQAVRDDLGKPAAIKILRDATLSPARRDRFLREQQLLAQLNHHAIARLFDADTLSDGTPYFIMEYVDGVPITEYCEANQLELGDRLRLFRSVCEAVRYAHAQAVVHRDLKPANIFATSDGQVKLLDFGIAKQIENLDTAATQTKTGLRLLTPAYAAPEQILGDPIGVYTDIYALGVILYELLTGKLPFDFSGLSPGQAEKLMLEQEPEKPSSAARASRASESMPLDRTAWSDLDVLCLTAQHKDPLRRYPTVDTLIRDIDHFLLGEPLEAQPDSARYRIAKFVGRNRGSVVAAATILVAVVALISFYTLELAKQRNAAQVEAAKARQISEYLISLFESGDPFAPTADSTDVLSLLARGVERAEALAGEPDVQAEMLNVLGRVYVSLSEYDRAKPLLLRAVTLRQGMPESRLQLAESLGSLAILYRYTSEYDSAETYMRESLSLLHRRLPANHPDLATALDNLGVILNQRGNHEQAEEVLREALQIRREIYAEPDILLAHSLNNLAVNLANQGQYSTARELLRESIEIGSMVLGSDHASLATDLANLGIVLEIEGDYDAADSVLTEALRIKRLRLGNLHAETAFGLTQLGGVLRRAGELDRAEAYLREAIEIEGRVLDPAHRNTAVTHTHLAALLQDRGDLIGAEVLYRRAAVIFEESLGQRHEYAATTRCALAHLLHENGKIEEAHSMFRECLAILEDALPPDHDVLAGLRSKFGGLLITQSRFHEAEPILLDSHQKLLARFGPDHRDTREAQDRLSELYERWATPGPFDGEGGPAQ